MNRADRPFGLAGKAGIVVGAGQTPGDTLGNGRAAALVFARAGARLLLVDRSLAAAQASAQWIAAELGRRDAAEPGAAVEVMQVDWTDPAACSAMAARCIALWGRIDLLHNNVGILSGDADPAAPGLAEFERVMRINLAGCVLACNAVLPQMRAQRSGSIVNISSVAAQAPTGQLAYGLSKAALNALGRELAMLNAGHGVRVNTVMPGLMDTPMAIEHKSLHEGVQRDRLRARRNALVPLAGGMGTAWDTAHASLFLHSDAARFVTGVELPVDGGQRALVGSLLPPA